MLEEHYTQAEIDAALARYRADDPAMAGLLEVIEAGQVDIILVLVSAGYLEPPDPAPVAAESPFVAAWRGLRVAMRRLTG